MSNFSTVSLSKKYKKYLDWIVLVYQYEKETAKAIELKVLKKQEVMKNFRKIEQEEIDVVELLEESDVGKNKAKEIENILNYSYPHRTAVTIPTKTSVTNLKGENYVAITELPKPEFLREDEEQKITGAQKGTLVHLCMQRLDEKVDYDLNKIRELINDLLMKKIITEKEVKAINPFKILEFTKSNIWQEVRNAKEVYKEKPFYINIPAKEVYSEDVEEEILVQGVIDLYYIDANDNLVLVDYKTDYVEQEIELINKYSKQLEFYQKALELALDKKVYKKCIYSVYLGKEIQIN